MILKLVSGQNKLDLKIMQSPSFILKAYAQQGATGAKGDKGDPGSSDIFAFRGTTIQQAAKKVTLLAAGDVNFYTWTNTDNKQIYFWNGEDWISEKYFYLYFYLQVYRLHSLLGDLILLWFSLHLHN